MLGQTIIYFGTRHQIGYRVGFTTAKLHKSGQYQKILKISALGPRSPIFSGRFYWPIFWSLIVLISVGYNVLYYSYNAAQVSILC